MELYNYYIIASEKRNDSRYKRFKVIYMKVTDSDTVSFHILVGLGSVLNKRLSWEEQCQQVI